MKKLLTVVAAFFVMSLASSCGTILPHNQGIKLFNYSAAVKLKVDGKETEAEQVYMASKEYVGGGGITYYGSGLKLDRKQAHIITLEKGGKITEIKLKRKVWGAAVIFNMTGLGGGPLGIVIDAATGYIKHLTPGYIDVSYRMGETKKKSHGKLKRQFKRKFKK